MTKPRGRTHTTLTETATLVVATLQKHPHVKMIAPGEIRNTGHRGTSRKFITIIHTTAGLELLISGQGTQRVAVHTDADPECLVTYLKTHKKLQDFAFKTRIRKPGM